MSVHSKIILALSVTYLLVGCIKVIELPITIFEKRVVVSGILNPDSTIQAKITYSRHPDSTNAYTLVKNATVTFWENDLLIGSVANINSGIYKLNTKPTVGKKYTMKVNVPNYPELYAEDSIPARPNVVLNKYTNESNVNQNPDIELFIFNKNQLQNSTVWFGAYTTSKVEYVKPGTPSGPLDPSNIIKITGLKNLNIVSNSLFFDRFNAFFDGSVGKYTFGDPTRIDTKLFLLDKSNSVNFTFFNQLSKTDPSFIYIFNASPQYDKYLKSAITAYQNRLLDSNGDINNPFAEPSPVYSNVKNGLGVWVAYSGKKVSL
jgi:Domain of unknown function (DUF4249)